MKVLLDRGADPNAKLNNGMTTLTLAVALGQTKSVKVLLAGGADVNEKMEKGMTVLMLAVREGHKEIVQLLKEAEAEE